MRPDDEYVDVEETQAAGSRAMSWAVLAVAVGGFAALAYYAYHSGNKTPSENDAMVIEADATPMKEAPANPEGEQFPDKDKTIYDVIAPNGEAKSGEQLMPEPERPIAAANVEDSEDESPASAAPAPTPATTPAPTAGTTTTTPNGASTFVAKDAAPTTVTEQPIASYANPQMVNEKPASAPKETPKAEKPAVKAEPKKVDKAETKPAEKPAATGGAYKVQLGAYKSEAEAQASWKKISGKYASVLKGSPSITTVESNGATLYRLRTGSFATGAAAKELCGKLGSTPCMPVK